MKNIPEIFASMVFDDSVMKASLPGDVYSSLHRTIAEGKELDKSVADAVASAMKDWAISKGATHYTHWFQPMTGITAEKHDSFIQPTENGGAVMEFSGKELIKGEPDASSFPSGGLRATFEARGYTAWDPTSYAFIKDDSLCIPTVFCSFSGDVLDKKTPLLRSMQRLNDEAVRLLHIFGKTDVSRVTASVGAEQEYFLVDKLLAEKRPDLIYTGRTLFGARPPKGQEMEDHYFGAIRPRVMAYMQELNEELWKLGVYAKTEHNEAAPAQHELAPIFTSVNTATDHNQLTMEIMKKVADRHGLLCLLHEKPFDGINGSGKHNNWSICTDTGINLLDPGKKPAENKLFLLFICAIIKGVDEYADLLRLTCASAGNDLRLGATEAPPAIVSVFLGDRLNEILENAERGIFTDTGKSDRMQTGVGVLPNFRKDTADRNRTSPMAFTGNKFEFRMLGSSASIADTNTVLNTIAAEEFRIFADELSLSADTDKAVDRLISKTLANHSRVIFNGNNYSEEWKGEAHRRGLPDFATTAEAVPHFIDEKNIELFTRHSIFSRAEITSRCEILLDNYAKLCMIEATTLLEMTRREIIPAALRYSKKLADTIAAKMKAGVDSEENIEHRLVREISALANECDSLCGNIEEIFGEAHRRSDYQSLAYLCGDSLRPTMQKLRAQIDRLEQTVDAADWPYPTYGELLASV